MTQQYDIFISYSHRDSQLANSLLLTDASLVVITMCQDCALRLVRGQSGNWLSYRDDVQTLVQEQDLTCADKGKTPLLGPFEASPEIDLIDLHTSRELDRLGYTLAPLPSARQKGGGHS